MSIKRAEIWQRRMWEGASAEPCQPECRRTRLQIGGGEVLLGAAVPQAVVSIGLNPSVGVPSWERTSLPHFMALLLGFQVPPCQHGSLPSADQIVCHGARGWPAPSLPWQAVPLGGDIGLAGSLCWRWDRPLPALPMKGFWPKWLLRKSRGAKISCPCQTLRVLVRAPRTGSFRGRLPRELDGGLPEGLHKGSSSPC